MADATKVFRKHWIVYLPPIVNWLVLTCLLYGWLNWDVAGFLSNIFTNGKRAWFNYGAAAFYLVLSGPCVYRIIYRASMKIIISEDNVTYKQGLLPWSSWTRYWSGWRIFQATSSVGFFEWLLNKSNINIVDTEGETRDFLISNISKGKECAAKINGIADRSRRKS